MDEIRGESAKEETCVCHHAGMACGGSAHRYCFKRCCMLRCFVAIVVLGLVFVAGVCAGSGGYHSHREFGRHGYSHYQMMQHGGWDAGGMMQGTNYRYMNQDSRRVIMMQRTVGTVPAAVVATTSLVK